MFFLKNQIGNRTKLFQSKIIKANIKVDTAVKSVNKLAKWERMEKENGEKLST